VYKRQELVRSGDEVIYFSSPAYEDRIKDTGAIFRAYANQEAIEQTRNVTHLIHQGVQVAKATYGLLPEVLSAVERERPDYLLFDMSAPWGGIASRQFGIPAVGSFPHLPFYWQTVLIDRRILWKGLRNIRPGFGYWRELQRQTARIVKDYRLRNPKDINILSSTAELNIVFSSRYFQPYAEHFDESYVYIGPDVRLERQEESIPIRRGEGQKLVYIAVGTVYKASLDFFRTCMEAFADDRYSVILSIGKAVDTSALGIVPGNFTVAQFVPQLAVLRQADVFITHGGMSSISEAVMYRVPMIVIPNTIEQSINAAVLEKLHAGLHLEPDQLNVEKLQAGVRYVLDNVAIKSGLERIRQSFLDAGGVQRGADAIKLIKSKYGLA
jgi:MGT family glycosyltransferase